VDSGRAYDNPHILFWLEKGTAWILGLSVLWPASGCQCCGIAGGPALCRLFRHAHTNSAVASVAGTLRLIDFLNSTLIDFLNSTMPPSPPHCSAHGDCCSNLKQINYLKQIHYYAQAVSHSCSGSSARSSHATLIIKLKHSSLSQAAPPQPGRVPHHDACPTISGSATLSWWET
jgi:hypothetical protein